MCQASRKTYKSLRLSVPVFTEIKENINLSIALLILAVTLTSRKQGRKEATTSVRGDIMEPCYCAISLMAHANQEWRYECLTLSAPNIC